MTQIADAQKDATKAGCEGIIVKIRDSRYETNGNRVSTWIKLKNVNLQKAGMSLDSDQDQYQEESASIRDTLDLIPIGGFYGKGSRKGLFGSYLMAAYSTT